MLPEMFDLVAGTSAGGIIAISLKHFHSQGKYSSLIFSKFYSFSLQVGLCQSHLMNCIAFSRTWELQCLIKACSVIQRNCLR